MPGIQVCAPIRHDLVLVEPSIVPMVTAGLMLIDQIMQFTSQTHKHTYKSMHTHTHTHTHNNTTTTISNTAKFCNKPFKNFPLNLRKNSYPYTGLEGPRQLDPHLLFSFFQTIYSLVCYVSITLVFSQLQTRVTSFQTQGLGKDYSWVLLLIAWQTPTYSACCCCCC